MASPAKTSRLRVLEKYPSAIVTKRNRGLLEMFDPLSNKKIMETSVGNIGWHYGENYVNEVDTAWEVDTGAWQYKMTHAEYNLNARNVLNAGDIIQYTDPLSGQYVVFQPLALNWVDNTNDSRQQLALPQSITAEVQDDTLFWQNGYSSGIHFKYIANPSKLVKHIIIDNLSALPNVQPQITNPYLEIEFILKHSDDVTLYVDGVEWNETTKVTTANRIEFRLPDNRVVWVFEYPRAWDSNNNFTLGLFQLRRQGNTRYCTVRINKTWIDSAIFPIILDPTIDVDVAAGTDDGYIEGDAIVTEPFYCGYYYGSRSGWLRFTGISGLSGATITTSYITNDNPEKAGTPSIQIYMQRAASPTAPTNAADYNGRTTTIAYATWTGVASPSPSLNDVLQELADDFDPTTILVLAKDDGSPTNEHYYFYYPYDWTGVTSLYIEYTEGGAEEAALTITKNLSVSLSPGAVLLESITIGKELSIVIIGAGLSELDQYSFRWRNDNGDEVTATWYADENDDALVPLETPIRLRVLIDVIENPDTGQFRLEYRKVGDEDWKVVS